MTVQDGVTADVKRIVIERKDAQGNLLGYYIWENGEWRSQTQAP